MAPTSCLGAQCDHAKLPKLSTDNVTLVVGPASSNNKFLIYADLAKQHSEYLKTKLEASSDIDGATTRAVLLPDLSAKDFTLFSAFIYTGYIYTIQANERDPSEWEHLGRLWIMGHELASISFKDAVVDALTRRRVALILYTSELPEQMSQHIVSTGIGRFIVDMAAVDWDEKLFTRGPDKVELCGFYRRVMAVQDQIVRKKEDLSSIRGRYRRENNCKHYHEHGTKTICYKIMFPTTSKDVRCAQTNLPVFETMMTNVQIGPEGTEKFMVRKDLAVHHSRFFAKALDPAGDWKEAKENLVRLPEESPEDFQVFITFLDTGAVHLGHFCQGTGKDDSDDDRLWDSIAQAWLLGERLLSDSFQDALVDYMVCTLRKTAQIPKTMYQEVFSGSARASGIRRLLVDVAVYNWFPDAVDEQPRDVAWADFAWDAFSACAKRNAGKAPATAPYDEQQVGCHYHNHAVGEACYRSLFA